MVTLLSGGEVIATYSYDAFGNITGQTGEADNSILYAGYHYNVETGLYYLNARMYDPVTARFLQADTYTGSQSDPLSLNLYTYCMNNPERYIDPSGHIAIELAVIVISAVVAGRAAKAAGGIVGNADDALPARMQLQYFAGEADGSGKVWDYSNGFNRELSNFNPGYEVKTLTEKDLYLVQLHSGKEVGDGRSLRYWTTFDEMNGISTIDDYMDKMALLSEWGPRDNVSIAKVPAGTKVKYVIGTAKDIAKDTLNNIEYRLGGGFQLLFEQFDEDWIIRTQKLSK